MTNILFILLMMFYTFGIFVAFKAIFPDIKYWKWQEGRQKGTKYKKFCLWSFRIWKWGFDAYILKYEALTKLNWHRDPVNGKHWRLNIKLKGYASFGIRNYNRDVVYKAYTKKFIFFRPDLYEHRLLVFRKTVKLSFGFVKFN